MDGTADHDCLSALGVFSRTEQRVLQAIFKAIVDGDGCCVATLATLARASNTSRTTTRNAIVLSPSACWKRPNTVLTD
jgi:hypothetical protein